MNRRELAVACFLSLTAAAPTRAQSADTVQMTALRGERATIARYWLSATDQIPDSLYGYRPVPEVRRIAELVAHIIDAEFAVCAGLRGDPPRPPQFEKAAITAKARLRPLLQQAMEYCAGAYATGTDRSLGDQVDFFGTPVVRQFAMTHDIAHMNEHYGNLVTYMRLLRMVPPSSRPATSE